MPQYSPFQRSELPVLVDAQEDIANYYDITVDAWHEMIAGLRLTACALIHSTSKP